MRHLDWLYERFAENAAKAAMIWRDQTFTYAWLLERVAVWRNRIASENVPRNGVVALEGDYSPAVVAAMLALIDASCVVVPLTASVSAHRADFLQIAEVQTLISFLANEEGTFDVVSTSAPTNPLTRTVVDRND